MPARVTLITGAAGDLGSAVARRLAANGDSLVLLDQDTDRLTALEKDLSSAGTTVITATTDVTDEAAVAAVVERAVGELGRLDALFNNAGVSGGTYPIAEHPVEDFRRTVDINLTAMFIVLKYTLPVLARNEDGWVVNTASEAGLKANERRGAYAASKAGVIQLSRACALEYSSQGVRVNTLCPGPLEGKLMRVSESGMDDPEAFRQKLAAASAVGRYGDPDEVAGFVTYLLTDAPGYLTGATLSADGCRR
ncbi:SDR family NAD(P)-dependent oxidoreductase [Jiangella sp. DSM 45060]|uniref:SDR family NAD(P)-dependent oxidoreductase n=1 Tax=Jiangella sp. DSM 45060 TaxID=1798224 RepID=UPI00087D6A28|nr:SDR family oxidoreductase [Jiangella sp. DSM 45060]SDT46409.1 NAD(P)-dependent dehydrogenase, short-chain alcohol dehydrogenase family [Jiangella sp. DSM 45060]